MPLLKLQKASRIALKDYMGLDEGETLLVLSDEKLREIGLSIYEAGMLIAKESLYIEMKEREVSGQEPPEQIAELMKSVDVVVAVTSKSLTHTKARREASKLGVRVGTMPNITPDTMIRCLNPIVRKVLNPTRKVFEQFQGVKEIHVLGKRGTNIKFSVEGRTAVQSTGILKNIGESGNIPSGEVYIAPIEDSANGIIAFDGSIAGIGLLTHPVYVEVEKGIATKISGKGGEARVFGRMLNKFENQGKTLAEFGIGTNPYAKLSGEILEDEKVLGTIHFAFGNNISFGGKNNVPLHIDGLVTKPTVYFDGKLIMQDGKLLVLDEEEE
ncbi:MAG: aminopeptidase [Candidatus Kapaibacteriota bacterium]